MKIIAVKIANALTSQLIEFAIVVPDNLGFLDIANLHAKFEDINPDCHVNFLMENGDFICGMPLNMKRDQAILTLDQYIKKWYSPTNFADTAKGTDNDLITVAIENINLN